MAFTVTKEETVYGNKKVALCSVSADAASGTIPTGVGAIQAVSIGPKSMASAGIKMTVSGGTVTVSNCANGDEFFLVVHGRG